MTIIQFLSRAAALALALAWAPAAHAADPVVHWDGNYLLNKCTEALDREIKDPLGAVACYAYLRGVADVIIISNDIGSGLGICIDRQVKTSQLRDIAISFLRRNAKDRHRNAGALAALAFKEAWPCQPTQSKGANPLLVR